MIRNRSHFVIDRFLKVCLNNNDFRKSGIFVWFHYIL